jgi:hypothetical protein
VALGTQTQFLLLPWPSCPLPWAWLKLFHLLVKQLELPPALVLLRAVIVNAQIQQPSAVTVFAAAASFVVELQPNVKKYSLHHGCP